MPSPGWNLVRHRSELKVPIRNVRQWLRVLNNSHLTRFWMSAVSRSGHFVSASAGWRGGFVCLAGFGRFLSVFAHVIKRSVVLAEVWRRD